MLDVRKKKRNYYKKCDISTVKFVFIRKIKNKTFCPSFSLCAAYLEVPLMEKQCA